MLFRSYLDGAALQLSSGELHDHLKCRFGHWYYGYGRRRYGHLQEFINLEEIHIEVHRVGTRVVALRANGEVELARALTRELLELKDRMLDKLAALQRSVAGQPHAPDFAQARLF